MWCRSALVLCVLAAVFCCLEGAEAAPTYALTPLLPSGDLASPPTAYDAGDAVGYCNPHASLESDSSHGLLYTRSGGAVDLGLCPNWTTGLPAGAAVNVGGTTCTGVAVSSTTGNLLISGTAAYSYADSNGDPATNGTMPFLLDYNPTTDAKTWTMIPSQFVGSTYTNNETGQGATGVNAAGQVAGAAWVELGRVGPARRDAVCLFRRRPDEPGLPPGLSPYGTTSQTTTIAVDSAGDAACRAETATSGPQRQHGRHSLRCRHPHDRLLRREHRRQQHGHLSQRQQHLRDRREFLADPAGRLDLQHQHPGPDHEWSRRSRPMLRHQRQPDGHRSWRRVVRRHHSRRTQVSLYSSSVVLNLGTNWQSLSLLRSINDAGQIAGSGTNSAGNSKAFLATPALPGDANLDGRVRRQRPDRRAEQLRPDDRDELGHRRLQRRRPGRCEQPDDRAGELRPDARGVGRPHGCRAGAVEPAAHRIGHRCLGGRRPAEARGVYCTRRLTRLRCRAKMS